MNSKYLYGIIIVIILIILFAYFMSQSAPTQNTNNNVNNKTATNTMSISIGSALLSLTLNITGVTNFTNTFNILPGIIISKAAQSISGSTPLNFISYNNGYLNFVMDTSIVNNTPVSEYSLQITPAYGISINDTDATHSFYNTSSVTVSGNTLTFTSKSGTLTITFSTNKPVVNTMSINVISSQNEPTSLSLTVNGATNVSNTFNIFSKFVVSNAAQSITGSVPLNFISFNNGFLNFVMDTSIVVNTAPISEYSLQIISLYDISINDTDPTHSFYSTSNVTVSENTLTFINATNKLTISFPSNFTSGNNLVKSAMSISLSQDTTSIILSVIGATTVSLTLSGLPALTISSAAQYITGFVPLNFIACSNEYINFIIDTNIANNIPMYEYSLKQVFSNQIGSTNSNFSVFYDTSSVVVSNNKLTFINGSDTMTLTFPNNFT